MKIDYDKIARLCETVGRGGTPEEADEMVCLSLEADNHWYEAADETLKALSVCSSREELLPLCSRFIRGVEAKLEEKAKRWIAFYAASILHRANRVDLLGDADVSILEMAFGLEDPSSEEYPKYHQSLERIRASRVAQ